MRELVLDASVLAKWFRAEGEPDVAAARVLQDEYTAGQLVVIVPPLLFLELMNLAAKRWRVESEALVAFASDLLRLGFVVREPSLERVARWTGRGLTAYDACYVALAEERSAVVVTADQRILDVGGALAQPLGAADRPAR